MGVPGTGFSMRLFWLTSERSRIESDAGLQHANHNGKKEKEIETN